MEKNPKKTGYLHSDFRLFYLTSAEPRDFQSHYHDFHKLLFFESGQVSYYIEGETYLLSSGDFILVPAGEVHRPLIHSSTAYRRLILYLSPSFFRQDSLQAEELSYIFSACRSNASHLMRPEAHLRKRLDPVLQEMIRSTEPGSMPDSLLSLYQQSLLLQLLTLLTSFAGSTSLSYRASASSNPQIRNVLSYINQHLTDPLSIDEIASACFLNRSYLMHLFHRETGYTIGNYITEKRLFHARTLIQNGLAISDACDRSGFPSYTSFYRAYRKKFRESPKDSRN